MKATTPFRWMFATSILALLALRLPLQAQTLLLEYKFNDSGTTTANAGTLSTQNANLVASDFTTATDLHGAAGSGVSGQAGDKALNLTSATGQGSGFTGPAAVTATGGLGTLKSFTLTGWYNAATTGGNARLFDDGSVMTGKGITLWMSGTNQLNLTINGVQTSFAVNSTLALTNTWVFYAVTYDSSLASNNISLYVGTTSTNSALASTATTTSLPGDVLNNPTVSLVLGNQTVSNQRPFDGLMDNVRLYGSATDASGVLSGLAIENLRSLDVVPEPNSLALLVSSVMALGFAARRRRMAI